MVELAITLTFMLMLLAGAVEFGIALFQFVQLRDAAQEGALYGSIHPGDDTNIEARVRAASLSPIDLQNDPGSDHCHHLSERFAELRRQRHPGGCILSTPDQYALHQPDHRLKHHLVNRQCDRHYPNASVPIISNKDPHEQYKVRTWPVLGPRCIYHSGHGRQSLDR